MGSEGDRILGQGEIANLRRAVARVDGVVVRPGETFSYWRLIGRATRRKGYRDGMVLENGGFRAGVGDGLCQLSNLFRRVLGPGGAVLDDHCVVENHAIMMYAPLLPPAP
jgi:vancomycin resistance protein YoaR